MGDRLNKYNSFCCSVEFLLGCGKCDELWSITNEVLQIFTVFYCVFCILETDKIQPSEVCSAM
jgi:hypothetical protein